MEDFDYIVPDMLVKGGSLPLQMSMEKLAEGFYDFYSTTGWQGFIFMIFPVCGLLGLIALSQKLANGDETWGRGCSNFIWKVMLAVAVLYVAPNSPKYMTELVNQTTQTLRGSMGATATTSDILKSPYISTMLLPVMEKHNKKLMEMAKYTNPIIKTFSIDNPLIYGENQSFNSVTGMEDTGNFGTGFLNVNTHFLNDAGAKIPVGKMNSPSKSVKLKDGTIYSIITWPVDEAIDKAFTRLENRIENSLSSNPTDETLAYQEIKTVWIPTFSFELGLIRKYYIRDYIDFILMEARMILYSTTGTPEELKKVAAKLDTIFKDLTEETYKDLKKMVEKSEEENALTELPGIFFDFSMIFVSIYVAFTIYLLPIVLPLWAAMSMLPESFQLSQSLKKGMSLLISIWLLPVFLDLIILVGNALMNSGTEIGADMLEGSLWNPFSWGAAGLSQMVVPVLGGFVSMMLIIASPLIVNKLVSGSSAFIETVTSAAQKGAAIGGAVAMAGGTIAAGVATGGAGFIAGGGASAAVGAAGKLGSSAADSMPGPMDGA